MENERLLAFLSLRAACVDVEVIDCPMCGGAGVLPKALNLTCPRCYGCGKTTTSGVPLSKWDHHEQRH